MSVRSIILVMVALSCGAMALPVSAQVSGVDVKASGNKVTSNNDQYLYKSDIGRFQVLMPGGCAKVHRRLNGDDDQELEDDTGQDAVQVLVVSCDRFARKGQGCSVTAIFNLTDGKGGDPGSDQVLRQVRKVLKRFGAEVRKQSPVAKEFSGGQKVEGIDVRAVQPGSRGELWVRGLLSGPDIYLLTAWNIEGGLWQDREYQDFFNSFAPSTE